MSSQVQTLLANTVVFAVVLRKWVKQLQRSGTAVVTLQGHIFTVSKHPKDSLNTYCFWRVFWCGSVFPQWSTKWGSKSHFEVLIVASSETHCTLSAPFPSSFQTFVSFGGCISVTNANHDGAKVLFTALFLRLCP